MELRADVGILLPFGGSCPHRLAALGYTTRWWLRHGYPTHVGRCEGAWSKARAVAAALEQCTAELLVIADADCVCAPEALHVALERCTSWSMPHSFVYRLDEPSTAEVLAGGHPREGRCHPETPPYKGVAGGGMVVVRREVYKRVPLDPRFEGWGQEDWSWATALATLYGECWRGGAPLWHLWHPPAPRQDRWLGSPASKALHRRYHAARGEKAQMLAVLGEINGSSTDHRQPLSGGATPQVV